MRDPHTAASELVLLLKLLPAMQELENVDSVYRLLLAIATSGHRIGYDRAFLFRVNERDGAIRGLYGIERDPSPKGGEQPRVKFEDMARDVFNAFERIEASDATLKARSFSVPLSWHRSAMVKAAKGGFPVLAERQVSEYTTDPFFEFFDTRRYVAVPIRLRDRVDTVIAADRRDADPNAVDAISLLYSLSQQASAAAQHLLSVSDQRRKSRILWKIHETLGEVESPERLDQAVQLAMLMLSRAIGASGCFLKDYVRQKTVHIKTVQEYAPDANDEDMAIGRDFEAILDHAAGRVEAFQGRADHTMLSAEAANAVDFFYACPLKTGSDVIGAIALYNEKSDAVPREHEYSNDDRGFVQLCAVTVAAHLDTGQKRGRIRRLEDVVSEISACLAKEREQARLGDRGVEFHGKISEDLKRLARQLTGSTPAEKRLQKVTSTVESMRDYSSSYLAEFGKKRPRYGMVDFFGMVRDHVAEWAPEASSRGIDLSVRIPNAGPKLLVNKKRIGVALANILRTTFSSLGKGDRMMIECSSTQDRAVLCIADNGVGLPGDTISRLFLPFSTPESDDDRKRSLSVAADIIQKHAGQVMIKSSKSWKTILILTLPLSANRDRRKTPGDRRRVRDRRTPARTEV